MVDGEYIRLLLRGAVNEAGGQKAFAAQWGISAQYIADVLKERRDPGEKVLAVLGYEKVVRYQKKTDPAER